MKHKNKWERKQILLTRNNNCCNDCWLPAGRYTFSSIERQGRRVLNLHFAEQNKQSKLRYPSRKQVQYHCKCSPFITIFKDIWYSWYGGYDLSSIFLNKTLWQINISWMWILHSFNRWCKNTGIVLFSINFSVRAEMHVHMVQLRQKVSAIELWQGA